MSTRSSLRKAVQAALIFGSLAALPAGAETLGEALASAYQNNAVLRGQEAQLGASQELVTQAKSGWLPKVSAFGSVGRTRLEGTSSVFPFQDTTLDQSAIGIQIQQPIYEGGRTTAGISQAHNVVSAQDAKLRAMEEQVFLQTVTAYMDVLRDQAILDLERNNEKVLGRQYDAVKASLENGEATKTDLAQAQARLSGAQAARIHAEGTLAESRATYQRVIGAEPSGELTSPPVPGDLPATLQQTLGLAQQNYPVLAARYAQNAAQDQVDSVSGQRLPTVELEGQIQHANEPDFVFAKQDTRAIMLSIKVPIYTGGALSAQTRQARREADASREQTVDQERAAREQAIRAWQGYQTAGAQIDAIQAQIAAAQSAYEGVQAQQEVGERTVLDVLDAEQELLNAKVSLVGARRNRIVAAYGLKAATGGLTAQALQLSPRATAQDK